MVLKRQLRQGGEEGSELSNKRRHLASNICKGLDYGRNLQESVSCLEPIIRKWVQEAVDRAIDPFLKSSYNQVECSVPPRSLQLQFHSNLPDTLFTGNRLLSEDRSPIKVVLYDSIARQIITCGPLSSLKVTIVVLDGDFDREDWTRKMFDSKLVKNREGKRPLVTGDQLIVTLKNGVGYMGDVSFTDNSSWIRSGKFRLGAKANANTASGDEISIREAVSNAFRVKDHRGESYQKLYPPSMGDEVWRLEKIAKDGSSHKKLNEYGIFSVGDFLNLYATDPLRLRSILAVSKKTWETIIRHATTCRLDGENYHPLNSLNNYHMRMVEDVKQHAWVSVSEPSIAGYPMLLESPAVDSFTNPNLALHVVDFQKQDHQCEMAMNAVGPTMSSPSEVEQDKCSFDELGESSHSILLQGFDPTLVKGSFDEFSTHSQAGFCIGGNYVGSQLSTDYDLPMDDDNYFQMESSSAAWQAGNGLMFLDPGNRDGIIIPRPKTRWCKVLAVVKWRILVRRNVAARKWKRFYSYM